MKVLVTGSNGFVGKRLCEMLVLQKFDVARSTRRPHPGCLATGELNGKTDWHSALWDVDAVIHLAARVHVMDDVASDPLQAYRDVNVEGSLNLARQAAAAGARRFVFVSSVKVNGEATTVRPFTASDPAAPVDPYGLSKLEAETALRELCAAIGMELVIVRPPLVYGPGVRANFLNLIKAVDRRMPMPLGRALGRRSMVALDNLADLLILCVRHPGAAGGTFLVSDGVDLAVKDLVKLIGNSLQKPVLLLPIPISLIYGAAKLLGKGPVADRLLGSLQVDIESTQQRLEWRPIISPQLAIAQTVAYFTANKGRTNG